MADLLTESDDLLTDYLKLEGRIWKDFPHDIMGHIHNDQVFIDWFAICKWLEIKPRKQSHEYKPTILVNHTTGEISLARHEQPKVMVPLASLISHIQGGIDRKRKHLEYKKEIIQKIGLSHVIHPTLDIEHKCLGLLIHSCPFSIVSNYRLGNYKIDAYIPDLRLAIEIDEHNHKAYSVEQEKNREREIRNSSMVLLRFNPHQHKNPAEVLVMEVWKKTLSPEMKAFVRLF